MDTVYEPLELELNNQVICDTHETTEEQEKFSFHEETDSDDIPPSLLSYIETSKSRAAVYEKLILEDVEDEYMEWEKHFAVECEAEQAKHHCEEMKKEEQKKEIERDFQEALKKLIEAERLHQEEVESMRKTALEKLEHEFLLRQEQISNLQRQVNKERRVWEEEQKRMKDEEDKRKREEEQRRIKDEEDKRKKEEEDKRKREEEQRRMKDEEDKRKRDEEQRREEEQRRMKDEEDKKKREEEQRRMKDEEDNRKREEEQRRMKDEEDKKKREEEQRRMKDEEDKRKREEEDKKKREEEDKKKRDEENKKKREEEQRRMKDEEDKRKREEEDKKKREEEDKKKREEEDKKKRDEEDKKKREEEQRRMKEEEDKKKREEEDKKKREEEDKKKRDEEDKKKREDEDKKKREEEQRRMKEEEDKMKREEEQRRMKDEEDKRKMEEEEIKLKEDKEGCKQHDVDNRKVEHECKTKVEGKKLKEEEMEEEEGKKLKSEESQKRANELQDKRDSGSTNIDDTQNSSQPEDSTTWTSSPPDPLHCESTISPTTTEAIPKQQELKEKTSTDKTVDWKSQAARPSSAFVVLPVCLPDSVEKKRLAWMKDCVSWSKLSLQNRRKQKESVRIRRGLRRAAEAGSLPPVCPDSLLQSTAWKSLQEVTLEDMPGCSLSSLAQCTQVRSLTVRRCGLRSLEGVSQLPHLCYIDVQENDISSVNCENMTGLRVLQLSYNKLTSIHGLAGAENVDTLDLSHNSITRIAGLESMRRLQRLSVDHNQLISTKGLRDVYTLLHLNCSHNHLASVDGLENSALLTTLDLRANNLSEPPNLNNHVLLRELHLDDNSISSLQGLTAHWLPLMQHLSLSQNRITQLPSMSDSVSISNLDLRFNCISELQNVCESLEGCLFLREVHLTGNPLQQESGWRSTLQKAVPGLRAIDDQETDSFLTPPAVHQVSLTLDSFLSFCQAQLQQTRDLQQQHSRELSNASSSLDAVKTSCRHFTETLQLATDQRFAHEYGDTTVADKRMDAGQTTSVETSDMDNTNVERHTERPEVESTVKVQAVAPHMDRCSYKSAAESQHDTFNTGATGPNTEPTCSKANFGDDHSSATKRKTSSSNHQDLDVHNTAAVVIQQLQRKYGQKCGNISSFSMVDKGGGRGGDGGKPESGPSYINRSVVGRDYAATVIQAFWRGFTLRRRLSSALAAVTCPDTGDDDTYEEVDVDEFVFDEVALEKQWTLLPSDDSPPRRDHVSEQPQFLKPPRYSSEPSQYKLPPPLVWEPKQSWVTGEQVDSAGQRASPESSDRSKSPGSTCVLSGLSERSEQIVEEWGFTDSGTALLMLKRAQKMKSTKKGRDHSARLAFRNSSYQLNPVETRNRPAKNNRSGVKVGEAELGPQQAEKVERVKVERAQQWLHTQAVHSDRDPNSMSFLPVISPDILKGGRVQLVADPGYADRLHHTSGLWASDGSAAQPSSKDSNYSRRGSLGHARKDIPSPRRATSASSKKQRISHRDNPVQLSGGWGGGKKRDKVCK